MSLFEVKKIKKSLANLVPAFRVASTLLSESVLFLLSSFNIPTLKSWFVLSDPFIPARGSWTLGKFGRLPPSGEDRVKESESLLLMPPGSHSTMSQYHTHVK